jgi:hypothetical protein
MPGGVMPAPSIMLYTQVLLLNPSMPVTRSGTVKRL